MIENIKRGDIIQFYTSCNADRKLLTGEVVYRYHIGFITVVDGVEYELNKLVDIKIKKIKDSWNRDEVIQLIKCFDRGINRPITNVNKWIEENL
jgi:hypothetical protein